MPPHTSIRRVEPMLRGFFTSPDATGDAAGARRIGPDAGRQLINERQLTALYCTAGRRSAPGELRMLRRRGAKRHLAGLRENTQLRGRDSIGRGQVSALRRSLKQPIRSKIALVLSPHMRPTCEPRHCHTVEMPRDAASLVKGLRLRPRHDCCFNKRDL